MADFLPWLSVAGLGALHGLNPANGWMLAAVWGVQSRSRGQMLRAMVPLAAGHAVSVALVAAGVVLGLSMDQVMLQTLAGLLLAAVVVLHLSGRKTERTRIPASHAGLALWSFMVSTAHGAGLMLVPAFIPLCMGDTPARELTASGSLLIALAAVGIHMAAMLAVTGMVASGVCRGFSAGTRLLERFRHKPPISPPL